MYPPRLIKIGGRSASIYEWAKTYGVVSPSVAANRIKRGWTVRDALTTPPEDKGRKFKPRDK